MTPRERLLALLPEEAVQAIEDLVAQEVAAHAAPAAFLGVQGAAEYLSVSPAAIRKWIRQGRLKSKTVGRRRLVRRTDLDGLK